MVYNMDITDDMYNVFLNIGLLFLPMLLIYNLKSVTSIVRRHVMGQRIRHRVTYSSDTLADTESTSSDTDSTSDTESTSDTDISDAETELSDDTIIPYNDSDEVHNEIRDDDLPVTDVQPDEQVQINKKHVNEEILKRGVDLSYDNSLNNLQEKIRHILNDL
jgi:hypothetical protein